MTFPLEGALMDGGLAGNKLIQSEFCNYILAKYSVLKIILLLAVVMHLFFDIAIFITN